MNSITLSHKSKFKHLSFDQISFILSQVSRFDASCNGKKRNTGKTDFITDLALSVGTSVSNIYSLIKDASITVRDTNLKEHCILSADAAFNKRSKKHVPSNNSKASRAKEFLDIVVSTIKDNKLASIDETINYLKLHDPDQTNGMCTVCTKTFYTYVHMGLVDIKPIDLPRMVRLKRKKNYKEYIPKRQKGTSIELRPEHVETREEFGHWEGDLVTGPRDGKNGAYLTLLERKTRFYYMIPIKTKSSKNVYMIINKLNTFYGDAFSTIFKSITFDNGNEFARWIDIEQKPGCKEKRTSVFFGRPYHSCDRASNENCNGLIRYYVPKGTDINTIPKNKSIDINNKINQKKRKILGYLSAESLFLDELKKLDITNNTIFYKN